MSSSYSFRTLKSRVDIAMILAHYGLDARLKRHGGQLYGPCPLHGGDNPTAFRAHLARGLWHCFTACGGGDTVELIRRIENSSYAQAARHLARIAAGSSSMPLARVFPNKTAFRPFTRSIALNPRHPFLQQSKRIRITTAARFEAGTTQSSAFLAGTVAVRLHDLSGAPLGYCGRALDPAAGKWRFPRSFPKASTLYNAHRALPFIHQGIILVECPWAAMRLTQAGCPNVVALLGTALSASQAAWLANAPTVVLLLDGDSAGRKASVVISRMLPASTKVQVHHLPENMEPEDLPDLALSALAHNYFF